MGSYVRDAKMHLTRGALPYNLLAELVRAADATGRARFVLERAADGTWSFGAPSMLSYSPRPGDMAGGATATEAMRGWIEANREGVEGA